MYVVTFYSFKGGVGRTQALVNVSTELAARGRRVLLVDFDLEAPGIGTFPLPTSATESGGVVEYVADYSRTLEAPDVIRYVSPFAAVGNQGGGIWLMPSGRHDASYAHRLNGLDWTRLYDQQDGYLLLEDLKLQWATTLNPDYVFIDSRTGHTDVGGICTRQLPDAVVVFFLPNDQNLSGLVKVVDDIRDESRPPRRKLINIDFVLSNVPDIDDEEGILQARLERFKATLGYDDVSAVIHRYSSLALLDQTIFTLDRPKTRLASQYRALADTIAMNNTQDRAGVLDFVSHYSRRLRRLSADRRVMAEDKLESIARKFVGDGEVLRHVASVRMREGRFADALGLWDQVVASGTVTPDVLMQRAEARFVSGDIETAVSDLIAMLDRDDVGHVGISRAVGWLRELVPGRLEALSGRRAIRDLDVDGKISVANQLQVSREGQRAAVVILEGIDEADLAPQQRVEVANELAVCLVGVGQYSTAMRTLERLPAWRDSIRSLFNYAVALWGERGTPDRDAFSSVCVKDTASHVDSNANYLQCLAIAYAVVGDRERAQACADQARAQARRQMFQIFSCWRYLQVLSADFEHDLEEIVRLIEGEPVVPRFMEAQRLLDLQPAS